MIQAGQSWSLSTEDGVTLTADELVTTLSLQHERMIGCWQTLSEAQWSADSRNEAWTVHDTARHLADVLEVLTSQLVDEPSPFSVGEFNPSSTPDLWLSYSADDSPDATIERYAAAAVRHRECVGERMAAATPGTALTPYGPAHWTMSVVHGFWDAWLHERDIALPLGIPATSSPDEQRLVAIYALLMGVVPARMMELPFEAVVAFNGVLSVTVAAAHEAGQLTSAESGAVGSNLSGDLHEVVDSLSGRGASVQEALPGAPDLLEALAAFLRS